MHVYAQWIKARLDGVAGITALLAVLVLTSTVFDENKLPLVPASIGHFYLSEAIIAALILVIVLRRLLEPGFRLVHTPLDIPLLVFLSIVILSTVIAILNSVVTFHASLGELRAVSCYVLFFLVTQWVRTKRQLRLFLKGLALLAAFVAVAVLVQSVVGPSVKLLAGRVETLKIVTSLPAIGIARVIPPGESLLLVTFIVGLALLPLRRLTRQNLFKLLLLGLFGLALVLTFFRHYVFAVGLALAILLYVSQARERLRLVGWMALLAAPLALVFVVALLLPSPNNMTLAQATLARVGTLAAPQTYGDPNSSLRVRDVEYVYALPQIVSHPIGLGSGAPYRPWVPGYDWELFDGRTFVHNAHVYLMVDYGLVGYFFFAWVIIAALWRGFAYWRRTPRSQLSQIELGLMLALIAILLSAIVEAVLMAGNWTPIIAVMLGTSEVILRLGRANATA